jgi:hypothetical protein
MKLNKFLEFKEVDFDPIKSFYLKDTLNPKVWKGSEIDEDIRKNLLQIGSDFYKSLELKADVQDIVIIGSMCNYNWDNKYSDFDLHVLIDFSQINDDYELVEKLADFAKKKWNFENDIIISGYDVEIALQDINDFKNSVKEGKYSTFSLMRNKWIAKPNRVEFTPNEDLIREKAESIMSKVDMIENGVDKMKYSKFNSKITKVWKKIKSLRSSGLEEGGEFSLGNLIFKLLRRNGYISKIMNLKKYAYQKQFD